MSNPPKLLFVSPVFPDTTRYGLAMRAGVVLEGLASFSQVYLLIVPVQDPWGTAPPTGIRPWCHASGVVRISKLRSLIARLGNVANSVTPGLFRPHEWRYATGPIVRQAARLFQDVRFDYLHVFRLYMTPFAMPYLDTQQHLTACSLDLDDIESNTRRRIAELYRTNGLHTRSWQEQRTADFYARLEQQVLPRFDVVYVSSGRDKNLLTHQTGVHNIHVLPNIVRMPPNPRPRKKDQPFTFLFVGNLNYYPNEDAVIYFLEQVLPCLRKIATHRFCVVVVGSGHSKRLRRYQRLPEWRLVGFVSDVTLYYH